MSEDACRCWANNHALGHVGHCCFQVDGKWRPDSEICHDPGQTDLLELLEET
ncbi:hypothetical protein [Nocardioides alcanivorans]|uniref:hypothetical protein n=1 Tax=Nocardioides alcanivorans TaxID=2897352 RepID=UPI001F447DAE|nr:hypothetical protein [Nocardioides alcanivorans]